MKIEIKGQNFPNLQETVQQCKGAFAALDLGIRNSPKEIAPKASQYIEPSIAQPHTHAGSILEGNASLPDVMAEIYKRIGTTGVIWRGENESVLSDTELQERRLQAMLNLWCKNLLNELSDCKDIDKAAEAVICGLDNGYRKAVALNEEEIAARFVRLFGLVSECVPKLRWPKKSNGESYEIVEALEQMKPNDTNMAATGKVSASTSATGDTEQPQRGLTIEAFKNGLCNHFKKSEYSEATMESLYNSLDTIRAANLKRNYFVPYVQGLWGGKDFFEFCASSVPERKGSKGWNYKNFITSK